MSVRLPGTVSSAASRDGNADPLAANEVDDATATSASTALSYWNAVISGTHRDKDVVRVFRDRAGGRNEVPATIVKLLSRLDLARAKILDVGAGPHTTIGPRLHSARLNITAVDPLAYLYAQMLDRAGITPFVATRKGGTDQLTQLFGSDRFDIIHARDVLGAHDAPLAALRQMVDVCVPGGAICIDESLGSLTVSVVLRPRH